MNAQSLSFIYKLLNTVNSPSFNKQLASPWKNALHSDQIVAINTKALHEFQAKVDMFNRYHSISELHAYLDEIISTSTISIKAASKKGLMSDVTLDQYVEITAFLRQHSYGFKPTVQSSQAQFQFHELLNAMMDYLLIKDGIENGMGHIKLDSVVQSLLKTKPTTFFEQGYLSDLFILDRISVFSGNSLKFIQCNIRYLSTTGINDDKNVDFERFQIFKIAA